EIIQLLLEHKADVNAPGSDYGDALQIAIQTNDIEIVKILLSAGADVNVKRTGGVDCTALMTAASSPWADTTMIKLLLDHGADINAVGGLGGTALCAAAIGAENKIEVMRVLLAHGAYANMRGGPQARYVNPLHAAVTWKDLSGPPGYPEGVRLLVEHGAQIN
ncbi:ankyrin repeat-containing domain protein, partial [Cadophora sp. MPI-SDFR-AT-0126]